MTRNTHRDAQLGATVTIATNKIRLRHEVATCDPVSGQHRTNGNGPTAMHQPEPVEAQPDDDESATRRHFAELMRRFWRRPERTEQPELGETE
jgi:hypothetical protein